MGLWPGCVSGLPGLHTQTHTRDTTYTRTRTQTHTHKHRYALVPLLGGLLGGFVAGLCFWATGQLYADAGLYPLRTVKIADRNLFGKWSYGVDETVG